MTAPRAGRAARYGFTALGFPAFRTFFTAQLMTNSAQFVQGAGIGWISWEVTGTAAGVAAIGFLNVIPYTLLTLHAGLFTDRLGARRMVVASLLLSAVALVALGLLGLVGGIPFLVLGVASVILGTIAVIGSPGSFTLVNEILPPAAVPSAVSLIFLDVNLGRILGGAVAGVTLALLPGGWTLILAGLLMLPPALAIRRLRTPPPAEAPVLRGALVAPLREAAGSAFRDRSLALLFLMTAVMGSLGQGYNYQLPLAAVELGAGADGLGVLTGVVGVGGLITGLLLERMMRGLGHGRILWLGMWLASGGMIVCGLAGTLAVAAAGMAIAGAGFAVFAAGTLSLLQALAAPELRGRLTALFSLLYWGLMPLGALIGGLLASAIGGLHTLLVFGVAILIVSLAGLVAGGDVRRLRVDGEGRPTRAGRREALPAP